MSFPLGQGAFGSTSENPLREDLTTLPVHQGIDFLFAVPSSTCGVWDLLHTNSHGVYHPSSCFLTQLFFMLGITLVHEPYSCIFLPHKLCRKRSFGLTLKQLAHPCVLFIIQTGIKAISLCIPISAFQVVLHKPPH